MAHVNYKGLLRQALIFILYFSIILISFFFWGSDKEYNLNQTIARGFISNDAIFFEIHDPSKGTVLENYLATMILLSFRRQEMLILFSAKQVVFQWIHPQLKEKILIMS